MKNLIMKKDKEASYITWIRKRIRNNLNFLALFSGEVGIGKSWSAMSVAVQLDPDFNPQEQVCFDFRSLMQTINNFNNKDHELYKRKYKVILFDEAQTDLSNREWMSKVNKLFNYLLSTFRHQNIILLFTSPYSDFLDSASMKLLHCNFECKGWSSKTRKSLCRPKLLQYNSKMKKFYEHSLYSIIKRKDKPAKVKKLVLWNIKAPPKRITEVYEESKTAFTNKLNKKITAELQEMSKDEEIKELNRRALTDRQEEALQLMQKHKDVNKVAECMGIAPSNVYEHFRYAKKKGITYDNYVNMGTNP